MSVEKPMKIYRVTYRAKVGALPFVSEIDIKTRKEKWEIDHETIIEKYLEANGRKAKFDEIIDCQDLGVVPE